MAAVARSLAVSVMPLENRREQFLTLATLGERLGYDALLLPETWAYDVTIVLAEAAVKTERVRGGAARPPPHAPGGGGAVRLGAMGRRPRGVGGGGRGRRDAFPLPRARAGAGAGAPGGGPRARDPPGPPRLSDDPRLGRRRR